MRIDILHRDSDRPHTIDGGNKSHAYGLRACLDSESWAVGVFQRGFRFHPQKAIDRSTMSILISCEESQRSSSSSSTSMAFSTEVFGFDPMFDRQLRIKRHTRLYTLSVLIKVGVFECHYTKLSALFSDNPSATRLCPRFSSILFTDVR